MAFYIIGIFASFILAVMGLFVGEELLPAIGFLGFFVFAILSIVKAVKIDRRKFVAYENTMEEDLQGKSYNQICSILGKHPIRDSYQGVLKAKWSFYKYGRTNEFIVLFDGVSFDGTNKAVEVTKNHTGPI